MFQENNSNLNSKIITFNIQSNLISNVEIRFLNK